MPLADLASYDDAGVTGHRSAWVLEPGTYRLFVGPEVRRAEPAGETVVQPESALTGIALGFSVVPAILVAISLVVLRNYRTEQESTHENER